MTEFPAPDYPLETRLEILEHVCDKGIDDYAYRKELTKYIKERFGVQGHKFVQYLWNTGHLCFGPYGGITFTKRGWFYWATMRRTIDKQTKRRD